MANHFHINTPLLESVSMSKHVGTNVYLKMENSQPSGSFKIRGIGHLCQQVSDHLKTTFAEWHQPKIQTFFSRQLAGQSKGIVCSSGNVPTNF